MKTAPPPAAKSPQRLAVDALLADGAWHGREEAMAAAMAAVAPGVAYRAGERLRRKSQARRGNEPTERCNGAREDSVASGRRAIANELLGKLVRRGNVERDGDRVRLAR